MIVRRSINKDELKELPKTVFPGRIHVIQSEAETEKAVAYLQSQPILGIDSETRPSFTKGQSHKVDFFRRMLFPVPPQYDRTHPTFGRPAGKSGCYQSRTVAQRRLYDAAQTCTFYPTELHRTARLCTPVRHTGQKPPKDLCHFI